MGSDGSTPSFEGLVIDPNDELNKISALASMRSNRDEVIVMQALSKLRIACEGDVNVMDPLIEAVKSEATIGEICDVMRDEFGTWTAPSGV